ncbi:MAG: secretin N-terminal domain-containing protein [Pirellulales bacterium]
MMSGTSSRIPVGFHVLAGLLGAVSLSVHTVAAQEATLSKSKVTYASAPGEEKKLLVVYTLDHVNGEDVLNCIRAFAGKSPADAVIDSTRKRVIVYGSMSAHERLRELLKQIDVAPVEQDQLKVFHLVNSDVISMLGLLSNIVGNKGMKIAPDPRTNSLLARGPKDQLKVIEALLMKLDTESDRNMLQHDKTYHVHIVWFAEGPPSDKATKRDSGLEVVREELTRIGLEAMRQVGQTMVSATPLGDFTIGCSALLSDGLADVEISGNLDTRPKTPRLKIKISAERNRALADTGAGTTERVQLVHLATEIVAPLSHYVVLGAAWAREG